MQCDYKVLAFSDFPDVQLTQSASVDSFFNKKMYYCTSAGGRYVSDQQVPEDSSADAELNLHWRLMHPPDQFHCPCQGLLCVVLRGATVLNMSVIPGLF